MTRLNGLAILFLFGSAGVALLLRSVIAPGNDSVAVLIAATLMKFTMPTSIKHISREKFITAYVDASRYSITQHNKIGKSNATIALYARGSSIPYRDR